MALYEATFTNPNGYSWMVRFDNRIELHEYAQEHSDSTFTWQRVR